MDAYPNKLRDLQASTAQSFVSIADLFETVGVKDGNLYVVFVLYSGDLFLMISNALSETNLLYLNKEKCTAWIRSIKGSFPLGPVYLRGALSNESIKTEDDFIKLKQFSSPIAGICFSYLNGGDDYIDLFYHVFVPYSGDLFFIIFEVKDTSKPLNEFSSPIAGICFSFVLPLFRITGISFSSFRPL